VGFEAGKGGASKNSFASVSKGKALAVPERRKRESHSKKEEKEVTFPPFTT